MTERFGMSSDEFADTTLVLTPCATCRHKVRGTFTCAAFPRGIPFEIMTGAHWHQTPYAGDNGIQYEYEDTPENRRVRTAYPKQPKKS